MTQTITQRILLDQHGIAVFHLALENETAERLLDLFLDQPFERPGSVVGIVARLRRDNRARIHVAATKLITERRFEDDGTVIIRSADL